MREVTDWLNSLPVLTRHWFLGTVILSLIGRFGFLGIEPYYLILSYRRIVKNYEIWRLVTCLFYYPVGWQWLINLYHLVSYSKPLEKGEFNLRPADYALMLILNWIMCLLAAIYMHMAVIMYPMVLSVIYVWCNLNKNVIVSFWFGTQFRALYLPWAIACLNVVVFGGGLSEFTGILVGHFYYFLKFEFPRQSGHQILITPAFLEKLFPPAFARAGFGNNNNAAGAGHRWGRGQALGGG